MSAVTRAAVEGVLRQYTDPYLNLDPVSAGCVRAIDILGAQVAVQLQLGYAAGLFKNGWAQVLQTAIENLDGVASAQVSIECVVAAHKAQAQVPAMANVKNIVAVAS
ncbi:iron-sulfur cluster assembly protein, partial [Pseudomonas plecoglossicida]